MFYDISCERAWKEELKWWEWGTEPEKRANKIEKSRSRWIIDGDRLQQSAAQCVSGEGDVRGTSNPPYLRICERALEVDRLSTNYELLLVATESGHFKWFIALLEINLCQPSGEREGGGAQSAATESEINWNRFKMSHCLHNIDGKFIGKRLKQFNLSVILNKNVDIISKTAHLTRQNKHLLCVGSKWGIEL